MTREECLEAVRHPGKFEREQPYVPFYWQVYLDGGADRDETMTTWTIEVRNWIGSSKCGLLVVSGRHGKILGFDTTAEDRALFPELKGQRTVRLVETNDGFVCEI